MVCTVHAVIVPPMQNGTAYAHARSGECVVFTGEPAKMLGLCNAVRLYNEGTGEAVIVETEDWERALCISSSACLADCAHVALAA